MMPSASPSAVTACCSLGLTSWDTSAVEMSPEISRSSMALTVTAFPWPAASAAARSAVRSASSLVEEGSPVPALTTTSLNGSRSSAGVHSSMSPFWWLAATRAGGGLVSQLQADRFQLPELARGQPGRHGAGHAAGVSAADLALQRPAGLR